ncbi:hypothetical protein MAC_08532 [Metarhizium acridum CQMa 102]|uniref:Myb-like domain-containing protein n=1 Tax=Metarhizium acridum (strain CQMa 102) TaxID=655827 RepID=E9EF84_METAQ|nr:uncharacterized protein MAC_08532 [Metarhizium acridum CQMa 102]EFY85400.1 hypothetical protein MAC_08532 [Metarhizium acridum CQMa 102]
MDYYEENPNQLHYESLNKDSTTEGMNMHMPQVPGPITSCQNGFPFAYQPGALLSLTDGTFVNSEAYISSMPFFSYGSDTIDSNFGIQAPREYLMRPSVVPRTNMTYNAAPSLSGLGTYSTVPGYFRRPSLTPISSTATTSLASPGIPPASLATLLSRQNQQNEESRPETLTAPLRATKSCTTRRIEEDRALLEYREQGLSYAVIKKKLRSNVAESTLRGRHRQLTLAPKDRERKPSWTDNDVGLLLKAVPLYRKPSGKSKVFWERVGQYILDHGGSRKFSGKTCHAKYREKTGRDY